MTGTGGDAAAGGRPARRSAALLLLAALLAALVLTTGSPGAGAAVVAPADVGAPSWWSGDCDADHWNAAAAAKGWTGVGAHRLGASYLGVPVCGPRHNTDGGPDVQWSRAGWGHYEWECPELAMRFMAQVYGVAAYGANGNTVVSNYRTSYGGNLVVVANGTLGTAPRAGDVVSFTSTSSAAGHVAVVASSTVDSAGNGSVTMLSQNDTVDGWRTLAVVNWTLQSFGTYTPYGWLHDPAGRGGGPPPAPTVVQTPDGRVFRIVGGAPLLITDWAALGGALAATPVADLSAFATYPADGTLVGSAEDGKLWKFAGGAPLYLTSCPVGVCVGPITTVNAASLGGASGFSAGHVRALPVDGTLVATAEDGRLYKVAGGGALYLTTCGPGVCDRPQVVVNAGSLQASTAYSFGHLLATPADGTVLIGSPSGTYWVMFGGHRAATSATPGGVRIDDGTIAALPLRLPSGMHAVSPTRVLDSRSGVGGYATPWGAGTTRSIQVAGGAQAGVPADGVSAIVLNVTVTNPTFTGYATVYPSGSGRPAASNLNWVAGQTVANSVTVPVGPDGRVAIFNSVGSVDVIADVVGWFDDGTVGPASLFNPVVPTRILDSRIATGGWSTPWGPGTTRSVRVTDSYGSGVPAAGVSAVVLNVTATGTTAPGYLTVFPAGAARPTASNLNWAAGETRPNLVTVPVGANGQVSIFNAAGQVDVLADVVGYYAATGAGFHPVTTTRILDSRTNTGGYATPWGPSTVRGVQTTGTYSSGVPTSGVVAVVMNVTVTDTTGSSYLAVHPGDVVAPAASNLNWLAGWTVPNEVITKVSPAGVANITNGSGSTAVIADIAGWFG